jgi:hypothetical protein
MSAVRVVHDPAAFVAVPAARRDRLRHAVAADHADAEQIRARRIVEMREEEPEPQRDRAARRQRDRRRLDGRQSTLDVVAAGGRRCGEPVIRQFTEPPSQVPGCSEMPFWLVGCGSPRRQRPVVAGF